MSTTADSAQASRRARLTLLPGREAQREAAAPEDRRAPLRLVHGQREQTSILIAGSDERRRSSLLAELSARMPQGTSFKEASATWEVLEHAPKSRMVMLAGELEGGSAESVMHLLGNRHPQLPVLALGALAAG